MKYFIVEKNNQLYHINQHDVYYVYTKNDAPHLVFYCTEDGEFYNRTTLKALLEQKSYLFKRCHRSVIINLEKVKSLDPQKRLISFSRSIQSVVLEEFKAG